jgi:hypothetical protein
MPGRPNDVPTVVHRIKRAARIRRAIDNLIGRPQAVPRLGRILVDGQEGDRNATGHNSIYVYQEAPVSERFVFYRKISLITAKIQDIRCTVSHSE